MNILKNKPSFILLLNVLIYFLFISTFSKLYLKHFFVPFVSLLHVYVCVYVYNINKVKWHFAPLNLYTRRNRGEYSSNIPLGWNRYIGKWRPLVVFGLNRYRPLLHPQNINRLDPPPSGLLTNHHPIFFFKRYMGIFLSCASSVR